uniref:ATP synthase subunit a n=1 Tax=Ptilocaulis walpersi TaxID=479640 RepID=I6LIK3_9METZ|nr:ATP synthase F0 subunit 6 [Ptilocaulis walpersi]ABW83884.1 ATP synthase F0 subunit 6 [Ptilocaulis walpersi]
MLSEFFDQFNIVSLVSIPVFFGNWLITFTNSSLMMTSVIIFLSLFFFNNKLIPNRWQSIMELIYVNIRYTVHDNLRFVGQKYFPFIISIFLFIAIMNILGLFPFVFTPTAHIIITFGMSFSIIIAIIISGFITFKLNFLSILMPGGVPIFLAPFLVVIETLSFMIRAISLGVRLAANISAGHLLFAILSGFAFNMFINGLMFLSIFPLLIMIFITLLEIMVAVIQAYVFTLLTTIYFVDTIALH